MIEMLNEILEQPEILKKSIERFRYELKDLVSEIRRSKIDSVVIAARGSSDNAGIYGKYIIEYLLGLPVALASPSILTIYNKKLYFTNKLVIGISQSGRAEDVKAVVKSANENGALTVSITNDVNSPLAAEAKYHLYCNAGIEKSVAATKTFTSEMLILALLAIEYSHDIQTYEELLAMPDNLLKFINQESFKNKIERYRYMNECFVLARGINYPIALEAALKIQETSYVRAKAYAISDFYHGPFAMIDTDMHVIVLAPKGPSEKDALDMIDKLNEKEAEIIIVSNDRELLSRGYCSFEIPETENDMISAFYNVVVAQMFAYELTLSKGLDPDNPRSLNKITITK